MKNNVKKDQIIKESEIEDDFGITLMSTNQNKFNFDDKEFF